MCDPVSAIMAASTVVSIGSDIVQNQAQKKKAEAVQSSAKANAAAQIGQLDVRAGQEQQSANMSIMQADRQARLADAQGRVSAGEAGVAGASVDALLTDIQNKDDQYKTNTDINLQDNLDQIQAEKQGVYAQEQSQINSAPFPSDLATGIQIAGQGLNFASDVMIRRGNANKG